MKHTIARSIAILIGAGLFVYVGWLFLQGYHVAAAESQTANMFAMIACAGIALFILGSVFVPSLMPTNRWTLLIVGIIIIMGADIYLQDVASRMIYLQDIMKLVGVFLVIVGPMKFLVSPEKELELATKDVEIIEV